MQVHATVHSATREYAFVFNIHKSKNPNEQKIEPSFYEQWTPLKQVFNDTHHEIQVTFSDVHNLRENTLIHIHTSKKDMKMYIPWVYQVTNLANAKKMVQFWCLVTVFILEKGYDLAFIYDKYHVCKKDFEVINTLIERQYKIYFSTLSFN